MRTYATLLLPLLVVGGCASDEDPPLLELELEVAVAGLGGPGGGCNATVFGPGLFSTEADEGRLVFSADGRHAFFHRFYPGLGNRILESHKSGGQWSTPTVVPFSSGHEEFDAFLTLDGRTLYYTSFRPIPGATEPRGDGDLWKVDRNPNGSWGTPAYVPDVNTTANEFFPSLTADGTLFFNSDRPGGPGAWDLYSARRRGNGFHPPQPLRGAVNTGIWEYNPSPSPSGVLLAFASLDPDPTAPYSDAFFSLWTPAGYSERIDAGPCVNTEGEEYHPTLDIPGGRLVFVRRDPFDPLGHGDFYEVKLPQLVWSVWR
jgi:hypothetical protein